MSIKIESMEDVKTILDSLIPYENYIKTLEEGSISYELTCDKVQDCFIEIDTYLVGTQKLTKENQVKAMMRIDAYWDYVKCDIDFEEFKNKIEKYK